MLNALPPSSSSSSSLHQMKQNEPIIFMIHTMIESSAPRPQLYQQVRSWCPPSLCTRRSCHRTSRLSSLTVSSSVSSVTAHPIPPFGGCYFFLPMVFAWLECILVSLTAAPCKRSVRPWPGHPIDSHLQCLFMHHCLGIKGKVTDGPSASL